MHFGCRCLIAACLLFGGNQAVRAADARASNDPPDVLAGHSKHGSAFDEGPRTAAYLLGNTGKVHFPVSTSMPLAQQLFDQGIGQLHGFWYLEAERSFRQVAALDPDCAMAYWGMAMANVDNESRAKPFIAEAVKRKKGTTAIEAMWIASLGEYYRDSKQDKRTRTQEYVKALKRSSRIIRMISKPGRFWR